MERPSLPVGTERQCGEGESYQRVLNMLFGAWHEGT
jgi:hypothetical protein